jgi:hypothetical protein
MRTVYIGMLFVLCMSLALAAETIDETPRLNISMLKQSPDPVTAGDIVELTFQVRNVGRTEVHNIVIGLEYEYPLLPAPGEPQTRTILSLKPYSDEYGSTNVRFKARIDPTAYEGEYELDIDYTADERIIVWEVKRDTFVVRVTGEDFATISLDAAELTPGEKTDVVFTITNTGDSALKHMTFSWSEEDGIILPVGSDNTRYIKQLDVGESIDLDYSMVTSLNADPGLYRLDLTLEYDAMDASGNFVETALNREVGMLVGGQTDFDVAFSESSEGTTSLSVANVGNNPALAVTVRVPEQENFRVDGSSASIIGNLDSGDYTLVSFQIMPQGILFGSGMSRDLPVEERERLRQMAEQSNELKVVVEYTDTTGVRRSVEKSVLVQYRGETATGTMRQMRGQGIQDYLWIGIVVLLAIAGIVGFYLYRRRKKKSGNK